MKARDNDHTLALTYRFVVHIDFSLNAVDQLDGKTYCGFDDPVTMTVEYRVLSAWSDFDYHERSSSFIFSSRSVLR